MLRFFLSTVRLSRWPLSDDIHGWSSFEKGLKQALELSTGKFAKAGKREMVAISSMSNWVMWCLELSGPTTARPGFWMLRFFLSTVRLSRWPLSDDIHGWSSFEKGLKQALELSTGKFAKAGKREIYIYIYIHILYKGIGEGFERCSCEFLYVSLLLHWPASSSLTKYAAKQRPKRMSQATPLASGKPRYAATPLGASRTRQRSVWSEVSHLIYESLFSAEDLQRRVRAYRVSWSLANHYL